MVKPGYLTTEFWMTVLVDVAAGVALFHHQFVPQQWEAQAAAAAAGVVTSVYAWTRQRVKVAAPTPAPKSVLS